MSISDFGAETFGGPLLASYFLPERSTLSEVRSKALTGEIDEVIHRLGVTATSQ
jgi:hypothetical protein